MAPPNGLGVQLQTTALTASAEAGPPAARTVPRFNWTALLAVSYNALLGGVLAGKGTRAFWKLREVGGAKLRLVLAV